jgi:hypothetical protein
MRRCRQRLTEWGVDDLAHLPTLVERITDRRRRPILLLPAAMKASHPSGFWLQTETVDIIGYEAQASPTHQLHIIAHELAHIVCEHRAEVAIGDRDARLLFPDLDPDFVRSVLHRHAEYPDGHELEAEIMAWVLVRPHHRLPTPAGARVPPAESSEILDRLGRSFAVTRPRS